MNNNHIYLDRSTGSEASIDKQGILTIHAHASGPEDTSERVTLDAQETWTLLRWLDKQKGALYKLTQQTKEQLTVPPASNEAPDASKLHTTSDEDPYMSMYGAYNLVPHDDEIY